MKIFKILLGLNLKISKPEETLNEEFFNKIYPNSLYKLSDLLSNTLKIDEIKKILNQGLVTKPKKVNNLETRKHLFNTYKLPSMKPKTKNQEIETKSATFPATPQIKTSNIALTSAASRSQDENFFEINYQTRKKKMFFVKSPTVKITYQVGPSLTDTHSIRIQGKLLERIKMKSYRRNNSNL